ncbi:MAG: glycosyltransferase [Leptolyngbya sp. ERB_1_1]
MTQPLISVIIPTYGREEPLQETVIDVLKQDYSNYEVLVVDQTLVHEPDIQQFLENLAQVGKIQWFRLDWASLPGARNYAVRRSKGEILLFIDDDVQLEPGYLAAHARNYQRSDKIGGVAGRVFDRMKLADFAPGLEIQQLPPEAHDPGIAWYHLNLVHTLKPQQVLSARGCNMSYRREIFEQHGIWFDERFRGSAVREESDFCLRLRKTGLIIWYDPEASLVHLGEETGGCHDISTKSLKYQITFYHNHFLMGLKNLTIAQSTRFFCRLFDCHVLGHPPCHKSGSLIKIASRFCFYSIGFLSAIVSIIRSIWNDGQIYTQQDEVKR